MRGIHDLRKKLQQLDNESANWPLGMSRTPRSTTLSLSLILTRITSRLSTPANAVPTVSQLRNVFSGVEPQPKASPVELKRL